MYVSKWAANRYFKGGKVVSKLEHGKNEKIFNELIKPVYDKNDGKTG